MPWNNVSPWNKNRICHRGSGHSPMTKTRTLIGTSGHLRSRKSGGSESPQSHKTHPVSAGQLSFIIKKYQLMMELPFLLRAPLQSRPSPEQAVCRPLCGICLPRLPVDRGGPHAPGSCQGGTAGLDQFGRKHARGPAHRDERGKRRAGDQDGRKLTLRLNQLSKTDRDHVISRPEDKGSTEVAGIDAKPGTISGSIHCTSDGEWSYHLYLPKDFPTPPESGRCGSSCRPEAEPVAEPVAEP